MDDFPREKMNGETPEVRFVKGKPREKDRKRVRKGRKREKERERREERKRERREKEREKREREREERKGRKISKSGCCADIYTIIILRQGRSILNQRICFFYIETSPQNIV